MSAQLVRVQFYEDTLEAVEQGGKVWVSLRRCCESLGLDLGVQLRKLKAKGWASVTEMVMDSPDNSQREVSCIDLDTLPGWLFSIDARKVIEQKREKLARYQRDAARTLADHFYRRTPAAPALDGGRELALAIREQTAVLSAVVTRLDRQDDRLTALERRKPDAGETERKVKDFTYWLSDPRNVEAFAPVAWQGGGWMDALAAKFELSPSGVGQILRRLGYRAGRDGVMRRVPPTNSRKPWGELFPAESKN